MPIYYFHPRREFSIKRKKGKGSNVPKIITSVKNPVRKTGNSKPVSVNFDYDPQEDYGIKAFKKKLNRLWWF